MGCIQNCFCCHRNRHIIISLLLLLVSSLSQVRFMAEGRATFKLVEAVQKGREEEKVVVVVVRTQIGSRPPRCERRCSSCGHCEAVQVPIVPQLLRSHRKSHFYGSPRIAYSRGDDITNYKPMSWKCKCGDLIFNP